MDIADLHAINGMKNRVRILQTESTFINGLLGKRDAQTGRTTVSTLSGGAIATRLIATSNGKPSGVTMEVDLTNTSRWSDG